MYVLLSSSCSGKHTAITANIILGKIPSWEKFHPDKHPILANVPDYIPS
jgi:hypothetical protein